MENMKEMLFPNEVPRSENYIPDCEIQEMQQITNYEYLLTSLSRMGFDTNRIERLLQINPGIQSIEGALPYLIQNPEEDHEILQDPDNPQVCWSCGQNTEMHPRNQQIPELQKGISFEEIRQQNDDLIRQLSEDIQEAQGEVCKICLEECKEKWSHPECDEHIFCTACIKQYLYVRITESYVINIRCPGMGCQVIMDPDTIQQLVTEELWEKYQKFKLRAQLIQDPNICFCIAPNCEGFVRGSNQNPKCACPTCGQMICFSCKQQWHEGKTCEKVIDEAYQEWAKGKEVQLCPRCKRRIEKVDGCNHMTCRMCSYQWCWLCRGRYTPLHYSHWNIFGCPELQGGSNTRENWPMYRIYLLRLKAFFFIILMILGLPFFLVFGPATWITFQSLRRIRNPFLKGFLSIPLFIILVILTPIGYALLIPFWIIAGIIYVIVKAYKAIRRGACC